MSGSLSPLFNPDTVAVIGASSDPRRVSGRTVQILKDAGFTGRIFPVNANRDEVQGLRAYRSLQQIEEPVDLALITVPAAAVEDSLRACCERRVGAAIIFGSGFAEVGTAGSQAQERLAAIAREGGVRLLGPNCMGVFNTRSRAYVTFSTVFSKGWPEPGSVGLVSQSGAFGSYCYARARERGLGLSYGVTTGNEADIDFADCLSWLVRDESTQVIIGYMEGCRDGAKLRRAFALAREHRKPVVILKVGVSPLGVETALSHTAQMAGDDAVFDAVFEHYGVHRAQTLDELFDVAIAASTGPLLRRARLGMVTVSGGAGVLMVDAAARAGAEVPPLPPAAQARLQERISFATVRNPVDTTGLILDDANLLPEILALLCEEGNVDAVVGFYAGMALSDAAPGLVKAMHGAARRYPSVRQFVCSMSLPAVRRELEAAGVAVFEDPARIIDAIVAMTRIAARFDAVDERQDHPVTRLDLPAGDLDEFQAKRALSALGIDVSADAVAEDVPGAIRLAEDIGYPVAVKILSPDLPHKTDAGAVSLSLASADQVRAACERMLPASNEALRGLRINGLLVSRMYQGAEVIVALRRNPVFGSVIMVGMGGIYAELLEDRVLRLAPVGRNEALAMLRELRGYPLLSGARGRPPCDLEGLAEAIARLSAVEMPSNVDCVEINPMIVGAAGCGAVAVDCLIATREAVSAAST